MFLKKHYGEIMGYTYPLMAQAKIQGKNVLLRVDYNIPQAKDGSILEGNEANYKIQMSLKTLDYIMSKKPEKLVIMTHLGDPDKEISKGADKTDVYRRLDTRKIMERLSELWCNRKIAFAELDKPVEAPIVFLQNVRFNAGEKKNDMAFAQMLASHVIGKKRFYINDAFGTSHRAHASVSAITQLMSSYIGFLMADEIEKLAPLLHPPKQSAVVLGGLKISDKTKTIENLAKGYANIMIGGAMVNIFLNAKGCGVGAAQVAPAELELAHKLLDTYGNKIMLPIDLILGKGAKDKAVYSRTISVDDAISSDEYIYDVGPKTAQLYSEKVKSAKMVFWNGPLGMFEHESFRQSTFAIAKAVASCKGYTAVGGGETTAAVKMSSYESKITHVSTGGGASLDFLSGDELPALKAIRQSWETRKLDTGKVIKG